MSQGYLLALAPGRFITDLVSGSNNLRTCYRPDALYVVCYLFGPGGASGGGNANPCDRRGSWRKLSNCANTLELMGPELGQPPSVSDSPAPADHAASQGSPQLSTALPFGPQGYTVCTRIC